MLLKMRRAQLLCKIKQQNQLLHPKRSQLRQRTKLLRRISLITLAGKDRGAASLLNPVRHASSSEILSSAHTHLFILTLMIGTQKPNGIRHPRDRSREDRRLRPPALHGYAEDCMGLWWFVVVCGCFSRSCFGDEGRGRAGAQSKMYCSAYCMTGSSLGAGSVACASLIITGS